MMIFDRVDTRLFKAFLAAAQTENFTHAASAAGMTQSGVSQHIARLENQIGVPLFERINKRVLLTSEGIELKNFIETYSDTLDSFVDRVVQKSAEPLGPVTYAMPASCLKTPHFPLLLEERKDFQGVDIRVVISANDEIFDRLIAGEIDFGFVTRRSRNPVIRHELFAQEQYTLVGNSRESLRAINARTLSETPFIFYPGMDVLLELWRQRYFPQKRGLNTHSILKRGEINHLDGAITMVRHGVGCGIFPRHCVENELRAKTVHAFAAAGTSDPVGDIFIVSRKNHISPNRVKRVLNAFWAMNKA
jgi:LysR family transcriptional regulator, transcriptional activator of the cysJI operon